MKEGTRCEKGVGVVGEREKWRFGGAKEVLPVPEQSGRCSSVSKTRRMREVFFFVVGSSRGRRRQKVVRPLVIVIGSQAELETSA